MIAISLPNFGFLKKNRFAKEAKIREESGDTKGFSEKEMLFFWEEVIKPGMVDYLLPYKPRADLVIDVENLYRSSDI
jgi:hypothetical protein